jgi:hypothetical protein
MKCRGRISLETKFLVLLAQRPKNIRRGRQFAENLKSLRISKWASEGGGDICVIGYLMLPPLDSALKSHFP